MNTITDILCDTCLVKFEAAVSDAIHNGIAAQLDDLGLFVDELCPKCQAKVKANYFDL
jgi:hypothetical protein